MQQRWALVAILLVIQAVEGGIPYSFGLLIDPMAAEFGVQRSQVLACLAIYGAASCFYGAFLGRFLDIAAPRTLLMVGGTALAGGLLAMSVAPNLLCVYLIFGILFPISLIFAGQLVAISLITRAFTEQRGLAIGVALTGGSVGGAIIPNIVAAFIDHGWRTANLYLGLFALIILLPFIFFAVKPGGAVAKQDRNSGGVGVKDVLGRRAFWITIGCVLLLMAVSTSVQPNIAPFASDLGIPPQQAALLITAFALSVIVGRLISGYLTDRMELRRLWIIIAVGEICAVALLTHLPSLPRMAIGVALLGLGAGAATPAQAALFTRIFGPKVVGRVLGLAMPFYALTPTAAMFASWMKQRTGSYDPVLYAAMAAAGVSLFLVMTLRLAQPAAIPGSSTDILESDDPSK
ncbi:MAG: hypothetical protein JWR77_1843 [Rhizorhabdus sp.]|nr:hypothetical protein [Rhizorhabdus sp.]